MQSVTERVRVALDNLAAAGGPADVAAKLQAEGITGRLARGTQCVLANYIRRVVPETQTLLVGVVPGSGIVRILGRRQGILLSARVDATVDLPGSLAEFGRRFDARAFPALIEEA